MADTPRIRLRDAFQHWSGLSHQIAAAEWLDDQLTDDQREQFGEMFRADPPPRAVALACAFLIEDGIEGCSLNAYPDPGPGGAPWTIGWGSTTMPDGSPVRPGARLTQAAADALLVEQVIEHDYALRRSVPCWAQLTHHQRAALLSFAHNNGAGFMTSGRHQTIAKALIETRLPAVPDAMRLYVNPGSAVEAGLRQRREREIDLWHAGDPPPPAPPPADDHHDAPVLLEVPYYRQTDSKMAEQRDRSCFSSACAMLLKAIKPEALPDGPNGDDAYLERVLAYGDTTDPRAQLQALRSFGITARRLTTGTWELVEAQLLRGFPVPVGWLHRGPVDEPQGGGHWGVILGLSNSYAALHDPMGEPDLIHGGFVPGGSGESVKVSRRNFGARWSVVEIGGGRYRPARGNGWMVVVDGVKR